MNFKNVFPEFYFIFNLKDFGGGGLICLKQKVSLVPGEYKRTLVSFLTPQLNANANEEEDSIPFGWL